MECEKCTNSNWDKFKHNIEDYIITGTACGNHSQVDQIVKFKCLECGHEFEDSFLMEDLY